MVSDQTYVDSRNLLSPRSQENLYLINLIVVAAFVVNVLISLLQRALDAQASLAWAMAPPAVLGAIAVVLALSTRPVKGTQRLTSSSRIVAIGSASTTIILLSINASSTYEPMPNEVWEGFGSRIAIAIVLIGLVMVFYSHRILGTSNFTIARNLWGVLKWTTICLLLPAVLQTNNGLININDSTYIVIDELLAQFSGSTPSSDYSALYTNILGFLTVVASQISSEPSFLMNFVVFLLNLFPLLVIFMVAAIGKRVLVNFSFSIILLATLSIVGVCGRGGNPTSVFGQFSWSVRYIFPILALGLLVAGVSEKRSIHSKALILLSGVASALALANNSDFGLSFFSVSVVCALCFVCMGLQRENWLLFLTSAIITTSLYVTYLASRPRGIRLDLYGALGSQALAGGMYRTADLRALSPQTLLLSVFVSLLFISIRGITGFTRKGVAQSMTTDRPTIELAGVITALWGLGLTLKTFLSPDFVSAQPLFAPALISGFMILNLTNFEQIKRQMFRTLPTSWVLLTFVLLPFGALQQASNPVDEMTRVAGGAQVPNWSSTKGRPRADNYTPDYISNHGTLHFPSSWIQDINQLIFEEKLEITEMGYFGVYGNTVQLLTGIRNLTSIGGPEIFKYGEEYLTAACSNLDSRIRRSTRVVVVFGINEVCGTLVFQYQFNDLRIHVVK